MPGQQYLDTCPKSAVILFSRKCYFALGLGLRLGLEFSGNKF